MFFAGLKKAGKMTITLLLACVLAFNLLTIGFSVFGLRSYLKWMPFALLNVSSGSMEPLISPGDVLLVRETAYDKLAIGDIVTFHYGNELISHTIIGKENNKYITKGIANNYKDDPVGPEEYCAKVIATVPGAGRVLEFLTKPLVRLLAAVFVFVLLFGYPILSWIYAKVKKVSAETVELSVTGVFRRTGARRVLALFAAFSLVLVTPFVTAAKYVARLNEYTDIAAGSINFSSNYLSKEGNNYQVQGWTGNPYQLTLRMRNYSNDLLMNRMNQDLYYGLCVVPVVSDGSDIYAVYGTDYSVTVTPPDGVTELTNVPYSFPSAWPVANRYGPYILGGSDETKLEHAFAVRVQSLKTLNAEQKLRFRILASTSQQDQFFIELLGDFTFEVASSTSFLETTQIGQTEGVSLVTFLLKTNLIDDGSAMKTIQFGWDTSKLYLNEFEATAYNVISKQPENYNKAGGTLKMSLQAFSSVTLQFFKRNPSDTITGDDLHASLVP